MITKYMAFISAAGGVLDVVSDEGELLYQFAVPAGTHRATKWLGLTQPGETIQLGEGLAAFQPRSGVAINEYGEGSHETGANPDFVPMSNADKMTEKLRRDGIRLARTADQYEKRLKALDRMEHIPQAPKEAEQEVSEPTPAPSPEAKAE